jgi:hypothetical protein
MCPYFISAEKERVCKGSPGNVFSPQQRRQEEYCRSGFTKCVFFQLKTGWFKGLREPVSDRHVHLSGGVA